MTTTWFQLIQTYISTGLSRSCYFPNLIHSRNRRPSGFCMFNMTSNLPQRSVTDREKFTLTAEVTFNTDINQGMLALLEVDNNAFHQTTCYVQSYLLFPGFLLFFASSWQRHILGLLRCFCYFIIIYTYWRWKAIQKKSF